MSKQDHTEPAYSVHVRGDLDRIIHDNTGAEICSVNAYRSAEKAELIVRALNSHEALVRLLQEAVGHAQTARSHYHENGKRTRSETLRLFAQEAEDVLRKARGDQ